MKRDFYERAKLENDFYHRDCTVCGKEVHLKDKSCPHCGFDFPDHDEIQSFLAKRKAQVEELGGEIWETREEALARRMVAQDSSKGPPPFRGPNAHLGNSSKPVHANAKTPDKVKDLSEIGGCLWETSGCVLNLIFFDFRRLLWIVYLV